MLQLHPWDLIMEGNHLIIHSRFILLSKGTNFSCSFVWPFFVVPGQDVSLRNLIFFFLRGIQFLTLLPVALLHSEPLLCPRELKGEKKIIGKEKNNEKWPASTWEWWVPGKKQLFPVLHSQEHLGYGQGFSGAVSDVWKGASQIAYQFWRRAWRIPLSPSSASCRNLMSLGLLIISSLWQKPTTGFSSDCG